MAQWYHFRLIINPQEKNFDIYVDNMAIPLAMNLEITDSYFDTIAIGTGTDGTGVGYVDRVLVIGCSNPRERLQPLSPSGIDLRRRVDDYFRTWDARDTSGLLTFYLNSNRTFVERTGKFGIPTGTFNGYSEVRELTSSTFAGVREIRLTMRNFQSFVEGKNARVTLNMVIIGQRSDQSTFNIDATLTSIWEFSDVDARGVPGGLSQWQIVEERWQFSPLN